MSLEIEVMARLKEAMMSKDQATLRGVRAIKAALQLAKTDGSGKQLTSADEIKLLQKLVKQRQDSLTIFRDQGREDLAAIEREEIEVIQQFLPEQMSESELQEMVEKIISETGASSMKDMGKIMGIASAKAAGKADGKTVATIVKKLLS